MLVSFKLPHLIDPCLLSPVIARCKLKHLWCIPWPQCTGMRYIGMAPRRLGPSVKLSLSPLCPSPNRKASPSTTHNFPTSVPPQGNSLAVCVLPLSKKILASPLVPHVWKEMFHFVHHGMFIILLSWPDSNNCQTFHLPILILVNPMCHESTRK